MNVHWYRLRLYEWREHCACRWFPAVEYRWLWMQCREYGKWERERERAKISVAGRYGGDENRITLQSACRSIAELTLTRHQYKTVARAQYSSSYYAMRFLFIFTFTFILLYQRKVCNITMQTEEIQIQQEQAKAHRAHRSLSLNSILLITVLRFNNREIICSSKMNKEWEYVIDWFNWSTSSGSRRPRSVGNHSNDLYHGQFVC